MRQTVKYAGSTRKEAICQPLVVLRGVRLCNPGCDTAFAVLASRALPPELVDCNILRCGRRVATKVPTSSTLALVSTVIVQLVIKVKHKTRNTTVTLDTNIRDNPIGHDSRVCVLSYIHMQLYIYVCILMYNVTHVHFLQ